MSHYFDNTDEPEVRRSVWMPIRGQFVELHSANGVFSGDGLDHATAVLLKECAPDPDSRHFLDLGCGWGPIALHLASLAPQAQITAVDVNERALALTADNAKRLHYGNVRTALPDDVDPALRFDEIWSNPPIRIGKPAVHELLLRWLPRLADDGIAHLVIGKNLGADSYTRWLGEQGWQVARRASAKGFRVLDVVRG